MTRDEIELRVLGVLDRYNDDLRPEFKIDFKVREDLAFAIAVELTRPEGDAKRTYGKFSDLPRKSRPVESGDDD